MTAVPAALTALRTMATTALPEAVIEQGVPPNPSYRSALFLLAATVPDAVVPMETTATSEWAGNGARARNEFIEIPCVFFRATGDTDQATVAAEMAALFADVTALEQALRADPTLAGVADGGRNAEFGTASSYSVVLQGGLVSRFSFSITVHARI